MRESIPRQKFRAAIAVPETDINLAQAALYIALEEYPDFDPAQSLQTLDTIAEAIAATLPEERYPLRVIRAINQYLYDELGFIGNSHDYYDPRNSFLNQVLERRTGIPISLSLVYLEIANRLGFPMVGIGMPGHFIIRPVVQDMEVYVDPFHKGEILFPEDCQKRLEEIYEKPVEFKPELLAEVTPRQFLARMLTNLKMIYLRREEFGKALSIIDRLLLLFPDNPGELRDRGLLLYELERWVESIQSLEAYLELRPTARDADMIQQLLDYMRG